MKYTIGIDVGGTNIKLGLINSSGRIIARSHLETKTYIAHKNKLIAALTDEILRFIHSNNIKKNQINGIGIGLPGLINPLKGEVVFLPNIPGWHRVPLKSILEKRLKLPVFIDNDVKLITLAEWKYGAAKGYKNFLCITLGTGVGGGLVLNNELYRGEGFVAGEVGHFPYKDSELELYVGNKHLMKKAARLFRRPGIQLPDVRKLAKRGNSQAKRFWRDVGEDVGTIMAGVVNILNFRLIVVGGGVSNNFYLFAPSLRKTIQAKAMEVQRKMVKVVRARLGDDAGIIGAKLLVEEKRFGT